MFEILGALKARSLVYAPSKGHKHGHISLTNTGEVRVVLYVVQSVYPPPRDHYLVQCLMVVLLRKPAAPSLMCSSGTPLLLIPTGQVEAPVWPTKVKGLQLCKGLGILRG
jgi:hypothetical protein